MNIRLTKLKDTDAEALLAFEYENRDFFETMVPGRGDEYYNLIEFLKRHEALLTEQNLGISHFYLIKDDNDNILGRMNMVNLDKQRHGVLGYRVGQAYTGKGIATKALQLLIKEAIALGIKQLHAKTTNHNLPSQKVLQKNGFHYEKTELVPFVMNGEKVKFVYYKWVSNKKAG
ncbi:MULTISPECIES: GNAT family N-acetyltransferase [Clostridia]|uniref:GNAT family N-acetyltransferase n=1 Tax=Clostridia TaxID=186801 RepID=UPI000EA0725E|nr:MULTISPECIES: GNAT family N-acetyltransferase [Clostridia]NBJ69968.1 N-acetyltransferase [Roseburia sp. 1XD42-34]RKI77539.1 N-acetyltransferase [Clostridium sp. 1xD42-85]